MDEYSVNLNDLISNAGLLIYFTYGLYILNFFSNHTNTHTVCLPHSSTTDATKCLGKLLESQLCHMVRKWKKNDKHQGLQGEDMTPWP